MYYTDVCNSSDDLGEMKMLNRKKIINQIAEEFPEKNRELIIKLISRRKTINKRYFVVKRFKNGRKGYDVAQFNLENRILLRYYQQILKYAFSIKMPNRNHIIGELLNIAPYVDKFRKRVIFKFDLKNFYNSIDVNKVLEKVSQSDFLYPDEISFIVNNFISFNKLNPGIGIINYMVEILGQDFDNVIRKIYKDNLVFYSRYVDDCVLIIDCPVDENEFKESIIKIVKEYFGESVDFNNDKCCFINLSGNFPARINRIESKFDYLGYCFAYQEILKQDGKIRTNFSFGIAEKKIIKERQRVKKIINAYSKSLDLNLLLVRMDLYYKRLVYINKQEGKKKTWEVRGISQTYSEAKKLIEWDNKGKSFSSKFLIAETLSFFKGDFIESVFNELSLDYPEEIKNRVSNNRYLSILYSNKAVVLHKNIGYKYKDLYDILKFLRVNVNSSMSYKQLVKIYMNKVYHL